MESESREIRQPLLVLVNESAGRGRQTADSIQSEFEVSGMSVVVQSLAPGELQRTVARAGREHGAIGIAGGDGTLQAAAEVLAGTDTILIPIPTGTLNHFSRRVGIEDARSAAAAVGGGDTMTVPVGAVDDRIFLNTATFGLYADVVRRRESLRRYLTKWPAAAVAVVQRVLAMRRLHLTLQVDGEKLERHTPLVWVGVGWGSFPRVHQSPERRSEPDLELVILRPRGRFGVLGLGLRFIRHLLRNERPVQDHALEVLHPRSIIIQADRAIGVTLDGEVLRIAPPIFIGVVDDALRVTSPA